MLKIEFLPTVRDQKDSKYGHYHEKGYSLEKCFTLRKIFMRSINQERFVFKKGRSTLTTCHFKKEKKKKIDGVKAHVMMVSDYEMEVE